MIGIAGTHFIFDLIKNKGDVPVEDMRRSFNLGIGMILIVNKTEVDTFTEHLKKEMKLFYNWGTCIKRFL